MRSRLIVAGALLCLTPAGEAAHAQSLSTPSQNAPPAQSAPPSQSPAPGRGAGPAGTQTNPAPARGAAPGSILFSADEMQTDEDLGLVVAKGHVQITQDGRTLLADTVTYNRRSDTITASGHVSLQEPTGEVLFADFMELRQHFSEAFLKDVRVLLTDRSRLAANTGRRTGGERLELRRGVYSPCDLCREDPSQPPLWQIEAERIVHDQETHIIEYRDATIEIGGVPVFYSPYLSHPDPTVKRQSGLLAPTFGSSSTLGVHTTIPYFWALEPDKDITFNPIVTTNQGFVGEADYRQRFSDGTMSLSGSLNNGKSPDSGLPTVRGHIALLGNWDLNENWRTGFDIERASDQTYERVFHFGGTENFLTSHAFAQNFGQRSFLDISSYSFQTLRQGTSDNTQPIITPVVNYSWVGDPNVAGGRFSAEADLLNLNQARGTGSHRLSVGTAWTRPFSDDFGNIFTFRASVRGDQYYATDLQIIPNTPAQNVYTPRVFPQASLQWEYPWVRQGEHWSETFSPIAAIIAAPTGQNPATIPNEDSLAFDYSDTDLFVPNRYAGLDQVDGGQRIDYGFSAAIYGEDSDSASMLIGQSRRVQPNVGFPAGSGLEHRTSDIVGRFILTPFPEFSTIYRYRLSQGNFRPVRQEVGVSGGPPNLRGSISYLKLPPDLVANDPGNRDQISVGTTVGLSRYWTLNFATTRNLTGNLGTVSSAVRATYQDECLAFVTTLSQSGISDRDVKPGASIVFTLVFKNLGEINLPSIATQGIQ